MRIAIVGMGPSCETYIRHAMGLGDKRKGFDEVWTVNAFGSVIQHDRLFHMDDIRIQKIRADAGNEQIKNLIDYLQDAPGPIYTSRPLPKEQNVNLPIVEEALQDLFPGEGKTLPSGVTERVYLEGVLRWLRAERDLQEMGGFEGLVEYPLEAVLKATSGPPYFTSTPAYALALALVEKVSEIALFGIDFSHTNAIKAEVGRACCEFWLGRCMEADIQVRLPEDTWILGTSTKKNLYGYDTRSVRFRTDGTIEFKDTPAPTATEIEAAYSHAEKRKHSNGQCNLPNLQASTDEGLRQRLVERVNNEWAVGRTG